MCGIVGLIRPSEQGRLETCVSNALHCISHRGPDDSGVWTSYDIGPASDFAIGLGHVRLSIVDLSASGHQPMKSKSGPVIVFNGEIYNYLELREELVALGHRFDTASDTEVLLAAYRQWGPDCVERLVGMWAFAIWDGQQVLLSRDRLGKKPLYYFHDPESGLFAFASEIKALREIDHVSWRPNQPVVFRYLAYGDMERGEETFFEGIRQLLPATNMVFTPGERQPRASTFWSLPTKTIDIDESEAVTTSADLLLDSVNIRLRSDAPLGLSLSGGLDSTLILATMLELGVDCPSVFSASYKEPGYSESQYIQLATSQLRCRPHSIESDAPRFLDDMQKLVYHLGQPCKLPGPYSHWRVVDLAKDHVKVLLDGQGADELAGGYVYFLPKAWREMSVVSRLRHAGDLALTVWGNRHLLQQYHPELIWERVKGVAGDLPLHLAKQWAEQFQEVPPDYVRADRLPIDDTLRDSLTVTSLPALLRYGDAVTMAFGVENRCPFLDHRLVEFVSQLPIDMKIRGATTKWIFRAVSENRVPKPIVNRRTKMGFPTPVGVWIRDVYPEVIRQWLRDFAEQPFFLDWIDLRAAEALLEEHISGKREHQAVLWRILCVGAWLKSVRFTAP